MANEEDQHWQQIVFTPKFYELERLFLDAGCDLYFPGSYLYDLTEGRWLSYKESVQRYLDYSEIFTNQVCNIRISPEKLTALLDITPTQDSGLIFLLFDRVISEQDPTSWIFVLEASKKAKKLYKKTMQLSATLSLPKFKINMVQIGEIPYAEFKKVREQEESQEISPLRDNSMYKFSGVKALLLLLSGLFNTCVLATANQIEDQHWQQIVFTPKFYELERFFLDAGCDLKYPVGYLYNLTEGKWLSYKESIQLYPDYSVLFFNQVCNIEITPERLIALLDIEPEQDSGLIFIFFDRVMSQQDPTSWVDILDVSAKTKNLYRKKVKISAQLPLPKFRINMIKKGEIPYAEFKKAHKKEAQLNQPPWDD
ncbi:hypothetical protein GCM10009092_16100 [Bowmanella denitrificans]|uniref:Uncharacterized protein n=2 Tax=Bowmanella denitrificans TaxID=366582 RepID=A0ABP3GQL9_9ALTE